MDIFVGRGGNQRIPLGHDGIAPLHCLIEREEDNVYKVTPTSVMPTLLDGERAFGTEYVDGTTEITLGDGNTYPITELAEPLDASTLTDWGAASRHIPDAAAAEVFNSVSVWEYRVSQEGELDEFLWNNVAACQANYLIDEGKLRKAQELLYEAGDSLYAMQDGSTVRKEAYASLLVALAKLYIAAGREDVAREALDGASRVFASGVECSPEVKALLDSLN